MVASVPELVNRTRSSRNRRHSSSASRTAGSVVTANWVPDRAAPSMAATTRGWAWPAAVDPKPLWKSK